MKVLLRPEDQLLLEGLARDLLPLNGVPSMEQFERRCVAWEEARRVLQPWLADPDRDLRVSVLGPGWSSDIDAHLRNLPPKEALVAAGWLPLSRLGHPDRWAVVTSDGVVGAVDIVMSPAPERLTALYARCRRRGEVRVREVFELRELLRRGADIVAGGEGDVLAAAAAAEEALGGDLLRRFRRQAPARPPVILGRRWGRATRGALRRARDRRRRFVVAFSGVDGSGKSSLAARLRDNLEFAGVPASVVWTRPGMNIGPLSRLASLARRATRQGEQPGVRAVATGGATPVSRKGVVGAAWVTLVAASFALDVRRRHARAGGVVLYDRHVPDAAVTLDFVYAGAAHPFAHAIVRRAIPRADMAFYLDVPVETAVSRKPADSFGPHAVRSQLDLYATLLPAAPGVRRLDGTAPGDDLLIEVLRAICSEPEHGR